MQRNNHKLLVIGDQVNDEDYKAGTIMEHGDDKLIRRILFDVISAEPEAVRFAYFSIQPPIKEGEKYTVLLEPRDVIMERLEGHIQDIKPSAILLMGELSSAAFLGVENLYKSHGSIHAIDFGGHIVKVIPTFSPFYIARKGETQIKNFALDVERAYGIALGLDRKARNTTTIIVDSFKAIKELVKYIKQVGICTFDFETKDLGKEYGDNFATCLSLSFQPGSAYVIPLEHSESPFTQEHVFVIMDYLRKHVYENPAVRKIAHNLKFDMHVAAMYGITKMRGRIDDTMLMHHLLDETIKHGLKEIVDTHFPAYAGYDKDIEPIVKQLGWDGVPLDKLAEYSGIDTDLTGRICIHLENELLKDSRLYAVYRNEIMAAFPSLKNAEAHGMLIDKDALAGYIKRAKLLIQRQTIRLREYQEVKIFEQLMNEHLSEQALKELNIKINKLSAKREENPKLKITKTEQNYLDKVRDIKTGKIKIYPGMNFGSPAQLSKLMFTKEGFAFDPPRDRKTGEPMYGTGKEVIAEITDTTGFLESLQVWRSLEKITSTYLEAIYERLDKNNYIHTEFKQSGTVSGRLSSANPNLQNLPNISRLKNEDAIELVGMVKKSFIVPEGYTLVAVDYSQAELRIIASFAKEETMLKAYNDGQDLHAVLAAKMKNVSIDDFYKLPKDIQKEARTRAKAGNFGFVYGMSWQGFKDYAKLNYGVVLSDAEAQEFRMLYFELYPSLLSYHALYIEKAKKFGYVRTLFGRRRITPDIHSHDSFKRSMDERAAINSPIQGSAGEMGIFAAALLRHRLNPASVFVLNVHDALYYYIPDDLVDSEIVMIKNTCENLPLKKYFGKDLEGIGMKVDVETTKICWKSLEPYVWPEDRKNNE